MTVVSADADADVAVAGASGDADALARACRKNARRLVGLLALGYVVNYLDRNSIAYAGLTMNRDLGLTAGQFGWAAGIAILSYSLLEVPSNLLMQKVGARLWLSRIMVTWGIAACATALATGATSLYAFRLLLGAAEAGFFPGILLYLSTWFPAQYRTRILAWFLVTIPLSSLIGGPLAGLLLQMDGYLNIAGWKWMFILEGLPAIVLGLVTYALLVDHPRDAGWLTAEERDALLSALAGERRDGAHHDLVAALKDARVFVLTAIQFGFTLGTYGIGIWLPLMLKELGLSNMQVGLWSVPPYLAASLGMLLWARHVDRTGRRVLHLTVSCALAAAGLAACTLVSGLAAILLAMTAALIGVSSARAIFWTIPPRFLIGTAAAGGIAFINSVGILGGFVGPFLMGWFKDLTGSFDSGLLMMSVVVLSAAAFSVSLPLFSGRKAG